MTPERIAVIKEDAQYEVDAGYGHSSSDISNQEALELLAALEETEQRLSNKVQATKTLRDSYRRELAEAQQTIARLTAALIAERDAAIVWDGHGTIRRINEALGEGTKES